MSKTKIKNSLPKMLFKGQTRRFGEKLKNVAGDPMPSNSVYGGICHGAGDFSIIYGSMDEKTQKPIDKHPVYTDTVAMYVFKDYADGKKAFTGDICEVTFDGKKRICVIEFDAEDGLIGFRYYEGQYYSIPLFGIKDFKSEVVYLGDIFDNPEAVERLGYPVFNLYMYYSVKDYEAKRAFERDGADTIEECAKKAEELNNEAVCGYFYCACAEDEDGKEVWKKIFKEGQES